MFHKVGTLFSLCISAQVLSADALSVSRDHTLASASFATLISGSVRALVSAQAF